MGESDRSAGRVCADSGAAFSVSERHPIASWVRCATCRRRFLVNRRPPRMAERQYGRCRSPVESSPFGTSSLGSAAESLQLSQTVEFGKHPVLNSVPWLLARASLDSTHHLVLVPICRLGPALGGPAFRPARQAGGRTCGIRSKGRARASVGSTEAGIAFEACPMEGGLRTAWILEGASKGRQDADHKSGTTASRGPDDRGNGSGTLHVTAAVPADGQDRVAALGGCRMNAASSSSSMRLAALLWRWRQPLGEGAGEGGCRAVASRPGAVRVASSRERAEGVVSPCLRSRQLLLRPRAPRAEPRSWTTKVTRSRTSRASSRASR